jgi:hypothetical protein
VSRGTTKMASDEENTEAKKFLRIDDAFRKGDLDGLRAAVDDSDVVPNGRMPDAIGSCERFNQKPVEEAGSGEEAVAATMSVCEFVGARPVRVRSWLVPLSIVALVVVSVV